jgi:hypothetical protein
VRGRGLGGGETSWPAACGRHTVVQMVSLAELRAQVAESYDRLGMPSWPNPHPGMTRPREEEYSRVTKPERYRVVHARARVWAGRLGDLPGVKVETLAPGPVDDEGHLGRYDRGVRLASPLPDRLPLLLLERDGRWAGLVPSPAVLHISVVRPQITLEMLPDCGCDACDRGSGDLLQAIDETIGHIVGGPFVALRGKGWQAQWHPDGDSSSRTGRGPDHAQLIELCRRLAHREDVRLPTGAEAFVGRPWLT